MTDLERVTRERDVLAEKLADFTSQAWPGFAATEVRSAGNWLKWARQVVREEEENKCADCEGPAIGTLIPGECASCPKVFGE